MTLELGVLSPKSKVKEFEQCLVLDIGRWTLDVGHWTY